MEDTSEKTAAARLRELKAELSDLARRNARASGDIELIAVSKTHGADAIRPVLEAGHRVFGENRVQEAAEKWPALRQAYPDTQLHLIGALQSNKADQAVDLFDTIHSLDRPKLAAALARAMAASGRRPRLFVQVNTGDEPQKAGVSVMDLADFVEQCRTEYKLQIDGLMCLPPAHEAAGPHFALLGKLAASLDMAHLSMGMSADYAEAVSLGATHIRLGTAIFGPRG
ncbi:MAG TPA: YggS family pyridoxal phosphate-dependent enzyme [Rhodobiaceae bacterium]|jgi:pyridoxal phosphate enzyme (YggS family)|nr:YggS family pyridoxal phosphate-dependent enzyme [Rhodobiaceae bacterium]